MLDLINSYYVLFVFWSTYFTASLFFPTDQAKTRPSAQITDKKVVKKLFLNCLATMAIVPILRQIPQLLFFSLTWLGYLIKWIMLPFMAETWFYHAHRLMHHKWFYRWHSDHHAFIQSHALAGLYCSVVEMIFVNQLSIAIPYQILGLSMSEMMIFNVYVAISTLRGHAGIYFRKDMPQWMPKFLINALSASDHDIYHRVLTHNFGVMYLFDRIYGTYQAELRSE